MKLVLKIYRNSRVIESVIDSSKSNVFIDARDIHHLSLFDDTGNELLTVVSVDCKLS